MVSERAEIRRSRSQLIRYNLISISTIVFFLAMLIVISLTGLVGAHKGNLSTYQGIVFSVGCLLCLWVVVWAAPRKRRNDRVFRHGPEQVFVLTQDGLVCSFLGSDMPVPWADVRKVQWHKHGVELGLRVDPARYSNRPPNHHKSNISQPLIDGTRLEKWMVPDILDVKPDELAELLKDWQLQYTAASPEAAQMVKDRREQIAKDYNRLSLIICGVSIAFLIPAIAIVFLAYQKQIAWIIPNPTDDVSLLLNASPGFALSIISTTILGVGIIFVGQKAKRRLEAAQVA